MAGRHCLLTRQVDGGQARQKERRASPFDKLRAGPPSINLRRVNFGLAEGGKRGVGRKTGCPHYSGREAKFPD